MDHYLLCIYVLRLYYQIIKILRSNLHWYTIDVKERLAKHNEGGSVHTSKYKPWKLEVYLSFEDESRAIAFEKYLKSGSGRAFMQKRFL